MESLGTLAGGIAHDFNNILMSIFGHVGLATLELAKQHPVQERLSAILKASERARDLVRQILTFSRQQHQQRQSLRLQDVVADALALLRPTLPSTITLCTCLAPEAPPILADPTQIHQVLMNLCSNAAQAMGQRSGMLVICQHTIVVHAELAARHAELRAGTRYVQLTVRDNGPGMDAATLERIFEPFFTTKAPGEGTGLGLAVVHGIMKSHDGVVTVSSTLGQGATFTLFFPVVEAPAMCSLSQPASTVRGAGQHILFLDDEEEITSLGQHMLEQLGYTVTAYTQVAAALQAVRQAPQAFDLVISDFTMPDMNGLEVARYLATLQPQLPCILITGYGSTLDQTALRHHGIAAVLQKPFTVKLLGETIAGVLGAGKSLQRPATTP
jgi:CheY-like chemotaxis protein